MVSRECFQCGGKGEVGDEINGWICESCFLHLKASEVEGWCNAYEFFLQTAASFKERGILEPKIAEVGVYKGQGTLELLSVCKRFGLKPTIYCVDTWEGSPEHEGSDNLLYDFIDNLSFAFKKEIKPICADSKLAANLFKDEYFDLVYIDAGHDFDSVFKDCEAWISKCKKDGVFSGDDYCDSWPEVIRAVNLFSEQRKLAVKKIFKNTWIFA